MLNWRAAMLSCGALERLFCMRTKLTHFMATLNLVTTAWNAHGVDTRLRLISARLRLEGARLRRTSAARGPRLAKRAMTLRLADNLRFSAPVVCVVLLFVLRAVNATAAWTSRSLYSRASVNPCLPHPRTRNRGRLNERKVLMPAGYNPLLPKSS